MGNKQSVPPSQRYPQADSVRRRPKSFRGSDDVPRYAFGSSLRTRYPHEQETYNGPIHFNDVHGINITLSQGRKVASRTNSFCYAIAFTSRPLNVEERIHVLLRKIDHGWSGVMRFGFTIQNPSFMAPLELPRYACPDLTEKEGTWAKALPAEFAQQNNLLTFFVTNCGSVYFSINNVAQGRILDGVDVTKPLWGLFDIYGNTTSLELLDRESIESISPRESLGLEIGLPEGPVQLPHNMIDSAKISLQIRESITPICFSATMGNGLKCRNRTHLTAKRNFVDSTTAFTNTALKPGQTAYFYCAEANSDKSFMMDFMSFGIGVTTCDPTSIPIHELPFDSMSLMDRSEYWVFYRDFEAPEQGEYFALCVEKGGFLSYNRSRVGKTVLFHVDNSQPLYVILDLCGKVTSVAIVGLSTEPSYPGEDHMFLDAPSADHASGSSNLFNSLLRGVLLEDGDNDIPGISGETGISDRSAIPTTSTHDQEEHMPSGIYPHEQPSQGASSAMMAASSAPMAASALSWVGERIVINSSESNQEATANESNVQELASDDEDQEEIYRDALDEPESSSDDSTLENELRSNVMILETLRGDLAEILRPIEQLNIPAGAVGGSSLPSREVEQKPSSSKANATTTAKQTSKSEENDSSESGKECIICFDNTVNAVIYSCGHACLCYECGVRLKKSRQRSCPICRATVKDVIRIYQA